MSSDSKKTNKYSIAFYFCLTVLCLGILAALIFFFFHKNDSHKQSAEMASTQQDLSESNTESLAEESFMPSASAPSHPVILPKEMTAYQKKRYKKLLETMDRYPDAYAYIDIPDTQLSYPILQSQTEEEYNDYYLNHCIDGRKGYPGSIFTFAVNEKDFSDSNTVIYGHNMKDQSMFGTLKNYTDPSYLADHPDIDIYTPAGLSSYRIFAAVFYDDRLISYEFPKEDPDSLQEFLQSLREVRNFSSWISDEITLGKEDHIITLSTCVSNSPEERFLVCAVLQAEESK